MKRLLLVALAATLSGCSSEDSPADASIFINVGLQNSTNSDLSVTLTSRYNGDIIEEKSLTAQSINSSTTGYTSTEIAGPAGSEVLMQASGPGGLSGSVTCTATAEMVGTDTYGQVNIIGAGGTTLSMTCFPHWS
jgi:hypothetical protein